jgi:UDP-N-acetyl-D-glucosamine/UDP-N-acetyl-D-galactosamine dehydrogenase
MKLHQIEDTKVIGIIGLGYVGLPLAVEFGRKRNVIAYDLNAERINSLKEGHDSTLEVSDIDLKTSDLIKFTSIEEDLIDCDIFIVTVPTPIDKVNRPNLKPLINASKTIGKYLKKDSVVIYESTVYPGCTEDICVPILESVSGFKYNQDFFCGYSPERVNPGDKVNTVTKITKITSGSNEVIAEKIDSLYNEIITAGTFKASSIAVAEAAKVIENTQRDLNIALVNELSLIFDKLEIDTIEVLEAAGSKWNFLPFRPGMVGGHCIGVDPYYLTHKAEEIGYHPEVILAGRKINDHMSSHVAESIVKRMTRNGIDISKSKVGVLGITFKENCPDIRNTKIINLINDLKSWSIDVHVVDPWADKTEVLNEYSIELINLNELNNLDSIIVAVGHDEFRNLELTDLKALCSFEKPVFADIKSIYEKQQILDLGFTLFRL